MRKFFNWVYYEAPGFAVVYAILGGIVLALLAFIKVADWIGPMLALALTAVLLMAPLFIAYFLQGRNDEGDEE